MKRILTLLLALVFILSLAACAGEKKDEQTATPAGETAATTDAATAEKPVDDTVLEDKDHALWAAHGQYLLADGTQNAWGGKAAEVYEASALTATSLKDVKAISEDIYTALAGKEIKYLYKIDLIFGTNDAGWSSEFMKDGVKYKGNGSYAFKIAQCSVDVDGDEKVYAEEQWISDPHTAYVESLTPTTVFYPTWQEAADENGFKWDMNPMVIGGAGLYTLVIAQYKNASAEGQPGYGVGLVLKEAKDGIDYEEIKTWIPGDHTYGVIGAFNEWSADVAMTSAGDNKWTAEVTLTAGQEFKVRADGAWDNSWGNAEGGNLVCEADGTYVVTIAFAGDAATVTAEPKA